MSDTPKDGGMVSSFKRLLGGRRPPIFEFIEQRQMSMVFQPIVNLRTGSIYAHEALLRSKSPHFANPTEVFHAAFEADCVGVLGRAARQMAVDVCDNWPLFINLHPKELNEPYVVQPDDPVVMHSHEVHVEITESVPLSHFDLCNSVLKEIRGKGAKLAIDDLGAGYSNLKYIADLSPEIVKVDRELVKGLTCSGRAFDLVRHIVNLCHGMGAKVVSEGVETAEELKASIAAGADFCQGYVLARPAFPPPSVDWPAIQAMLARV